VKAELYTIYKNINPKTPIEEFITDIHRFYENKTYYEAMDEFMKFTSKS
jgi:hypothetical protein